ncbi:putative Lecithin:cholesterol acyltransferase [Blattamonas nauphoetae]|uniref:Lecithin:cholesterol acyltransferase n=1 Tax=Blattamonas nauphoetae TaxID=2049346 RepID=A0ABQ9YG01_9EUKA|nr:putative Lecithin:cholesterol acyltransferase [Blattamonas nauphoetae]
MKPSVVLFPGCGGAILTARNKISGEEKIVWPRLRNGDKYVREILAGRVQKDSLLLENPESDWEIFASDDNFGLWASDVLMPNAKLPNSLHQYYHELSAHLQRNGYIPGVNLWGCPLDWRQDSAHHTYHTKIRNRIEEAYEKCGRQRVTIISHSATSISVRVFIQLFPEWASQHIERWVAIAGLFQGAGKHVDVFMRGYNFGVYDFIATNKSMFGATSKSTGLFWFVQPEYIPHSPKVAVRVKMEEKDEYGLPRFTPYMWFGYHVDPTTHECWDMDSIDPNSVDVAKTAQDATSSPQTPVFSHAVHPPTLPSQLDPLHRLEETDITRPPTFDEMVCRSALCLQPEPLPPLSSLFSGSHLKYASHANFVPSVLHRTFIPGVPTPDILDRHRVEYRHDPKQSTPDNVFTVIRPYQCVNNSDASTRRTADSQNPAPSPTFSEDINVLTPFGQGNTPSDTETTSEVIALFSEADESVSPYSPVQLLPLIKTATDSSAEAATPDTPYLGVSCTTQASVMSHPTHHKTPTSSSPNTTGAGHFSSYKLVEDDNHFVDSTLFPPSRLQQNLYDLYRYVHTFDHPDFLNEPFTAKQLEEHIRFFRNYPHTTPPLKRVVRRDGPLLRETGPIDDNAQSPNAAPSTDEQQNIRQFHLRKEFLAKRHFTLTSVAMPLSIFQPCSYPVHLPSLGINLFSIFGSGAPCEWHCLCTIDPSQCQKRKKKTDTPTQQFPFTSLYPLTAEEEAAFASIQPDDFSTCDKRWTTIDGDYTIPSFSASNDMMGSVAKFQLTGTRHMALLWDPRTLNLVSCILDLPLPFPDVV